jgi:hypothetical protein
MIPLLPGRDGGVEGSPDGVFGTDPDTGLGVRCDVICVMKPSSDPLVLKSPPYVGDTHPKAPQWRAVKVRLMENADIEGKVVYKGPQNLQVTEAFVLKSAA